MIIDAITPRDSKGYRTNDANTLITTCDIRSVDQRSPLAHTELIGSSSLHASSDFVVPIQSSVNSQNSTTEEELPLDPPPEYEAVVTPSTSNATQRVLRKSANRSSYPRPETSGDSRNCIASVAFFYPVSIITNYGPPLNQSRV
jgi:hypothetical protein